MQYRKTYILMLLMIGFATAVAWARSAHEHRIVHNGRTIAVRSDGWWIEKYYHKPGMDEDERQFIEIAGTDNYLYAAQPIGAGDFHITARLAVHNLSPNTPAFACNSFWPKRTIDAFFFNDGGDMVLEGRLFGLAKEYPVQAFAPSEFDNAQQWTKTQQESDRQDHRRNLGPSDTYIKEGQSFVLEVIRRAGEVDLLIDGERITTTDCPVTRFGEVGFRSLGATIRLYDFSIKGRLLEMEDYLLNISDRQRELIKRGRRNGLLGIAPVHLPEGDKLIGRNWHFKAPIATLVDDVIILTCQREACHDWGKTGRIRDGLESNYDLASRSTDGGKTWTMPRRLADVKTDHGYTMGSMSAIGLTSDGTVVQINREGCYCSTNQGETWTHLPKAYTKEQMGPGPSCTMGPRLVETPYGLTGFQSIVWRKNMSRPGELWLRYSTDSGRTWTATKQILPHATSIHGEPSAMMVDGKLILLGRVWSDEAFDKEQRTYRYGQYWSHNGKLPVKSALTNIKASDAYTEWIPIAGRLKAIGFGPWCQDTPDIIYNPVTRRVEAVITNRGGGGQGREDDRTVCTLNLWSIDPQALLAGESEWRFEGTLLERLTIDTPKFHDGMHPAGGVVDEKRGLHHIFVWIGYYDGPAGIFRISRSLQTAKLSEMLRP